LDHFGEGEYDQSEKVIQQLLVEAGKTGMAPTFVSVDAKGAEAAADTDNVKSPETYVGYERAENFASPGGLIQDTPSAYVAAPSLSLNQWGLSSNGPSAARKPCSKSPAVRSPTASTRAICISSLVRAPMARRCDSR
jgi:hypothetical protein